MSEPDDTPSPADGPLPTILGGIDPGELLARGLQSVKMSSTGAHGWEPPSVAEVAGLFPTYEVLAMLGRGGMGAVFKARQIALDRLVAIKLLPLEISVDPAFMDRFRREARAMAKLNHPHIVTVHEFGQTAEGHLFFVMEFVDGADVAEIIRQVGLNPAQALSLTAQVCTALTYAHGKGVIHRDIKPANVMVDTESHVKVADFGLARLTDPAAKAAGITVSGLFLGTLDYMAPEQKHGSHVDHRADIYAVGVMLYEMLCRKVPQGVFALPSQVTGCDVRIDRIVLRAMQQEPALRYQSTQEMRADVESAPVSASVLSPHASAFSFRPVQPVPALPKPARRPAPAKKNMPLRLVLATAFVIVAAIVLWAKQRAQTAGKTTGGAMPVAAASTASALGAAAAWKPVVLTQEEVAKQPGATLSASGELTMKDIFYLSSISSRDIAIRGEVRPPGNETNNIHLRHSGGSNASRYLAIYSTIALLQVYEPNGLNPSDQNTVLSQIQFPPEKNASDRWVPFEFATVGKLSFATVQSISFPVSATAKAVQPGSVKFFGRMGLRKLEVMDLDGVPEAQWPEFIRTALKQSGAQP